MAYGRGNAFGSGVLIVIGFLFLGRNLDLFVWSIGDVLKFAGPLVLIIFGLSMIFKPKSRRSGEERRIGDEMKNEWKAYTYEPSDEKPVPPAPPLHPDPTKRPVGGEDAPTPGGETGEPDTAFGRQEAQRPARSRGLAPSKDRGKRRRATGMPPTKTRGAVMSAITPIGGRNAGNGTRFTRRKSASGSSAGLTGIIIVTRTARTAWNGGTTILTCRRGQASSATSTSVTIIGNSSR